MRTVFRLASLAALALVACGAPADPTAEGDSDLTEGKFELYFTNPLPDLIARGDLKADDVGDLATESIAGGPEPDKRLVKLIDGASGHGCSVLVANFDFDLQNVADAMVRAKKRGCDVRMVTDGDTVDHANPETDASKRYGRTSFNPIYEKPMKTLLDAGIPVHDDGSRGGIMHDKFVVVNGKTVWTGSWNMSVADLSFWNNAFLATSTPLATRYTAEFEHLFKAYDEALTPLPHLNKVDVTFDDDHTVPFGSKALEVYFPHADKATDRVAEVVSGAKESIHFLAFQFTPGPIADAVVERAKHSIEVRGVFENNGACAGAYPELAAIDGVNVSRWSFGRIQGLRNFLHHKVFIVDQKTVVFGSFNFSASADGSNDENLLILTDPELAKSFEAEYQLVEAATLKTSHLPPCAPHPSPSQPK
jgi:phosphatidylserine/phosphatidylglycerophosphate/cardiolipin synthase-like enzyme